jgi:hypothetical protein
MAAVLAVAVGQHTQQTHGEENDQQRHLDPPFTPPVIVALGRG